MIKNIKNLCEEKHYKLLIFLFFGLIIATLFELIGLSSLPLFAMLILDSQVFFDNLPNFINKEILLIYTQKELAVYEVKNRKTIGQPFKCDYYANIDDKHVVFEFNGNHHYQSPFKMNTDKRKKEVLNDPQRNSTDQKNSVLGKKYIIIKKE